MPTARGSRMQRQRDHGDQRTRDDERISPLHQGGGSGAACAQCDDEGGYPMIRRREFITLLGGAAAWPIAARAQQRAFPVIGLLSSRSPPVDMPLIAIMRQALNETGFVEGQNVTLDYRWAEGQYDRLAGLAADLVRQQVAVIV